MKKGVIIIGKLPPPYFGPAIATEIILNSSLKKDFDLTHIDTRLNDSIQTMGTFGWKKILQLIAIYSRFFTACLKTNNKVVILPIAQQSAALYKDLVFILIGKLFRKKILLHLRGSNILNWFENTTNLNQKIFKFWFSRCAGAIVLGEKLRYLFQPFFSNEQIDVIPNGGNYHFPEKIQSQKIEVLYLANLMHNKGLDLLLNALSKMEPVLKDKLHCSVVGTWETETFKNECLSIITTKHLPVSIFPATGGMDKLQFFSNADLFVFTPRKPEGHPWVIIEAMAAGLPIISTDQGAITESVIDGYNGFIISHENEKSLTEKLTKLVTEQNLMYEMSQNAKTQYNNHFTEKIMIEKLKKLILKTF